MVQDKEIVQNPISVGMILLFLLLAIFTSTLLSFLFLFPLASFQGIPLDQIASQFALDETASQRNVSRLIVLINHSFTFIIPAFALAWFVFKLDWKKALGFRKLRRTMNPILGATFILLSIPISGLLYWVNQQIPLPEMLMSMENDTNEMIKSILITDGFWELAFNILIIGVLPALGEELLFRGIIQRQLSSLMRNHHLGILLAAFIFSAIHMQFQGFLPRFFLGGVLGYLFYWTGNIWVPIIGHFAHNSFQVLAVYFGEEDIRKMDIDAVELPGVPQMLIFITLALLVGYYIQQINKGNRLTLMKI